MCAVQSLAACFFTTFYGLRKLNMDIRKWLIGSASARHDEEHCEVFLMMTGTGRRAGKYQRMKRNQSKLCLDLLISTHMGQ